MIKLIATFPKEVQVLFGLLPFFIIVILLGIVLKKGFNVVQKYMIFWILLLVFLLLVYLILSSKFTLRDNPVSKLITYVLIVIIGFFIVRKKKN